MRSRVLVSLAALAIAGCAQQTDAPTQANTAADESQAAASASQTDGAGSTAAPAVESAVCVIRGVGDSGVSGVIRFEQNGGQVKVTGQVHGLDAGLHGFHVHELGDLTNAEDGTSTGGHYNPEGTKHGRPSDAERHVGDLGNIEAGDDGTASVDMTDSVISLNGPHSILGRSIVIHAGEDKFTQPTGDAGARVGFGVIGIAKSGGE